MKRIVSGITSTGNLTIGNYLGAIQNLKNEQEKDHELFVFVADLHGLSIPIDPNLLKKNIKEIIKIYLAAGLDPKKSNLFVQSEIIGHTELFYLLSTITNIGQLERMTQFKDKSIKQKNKTNIIPTGILVYPILMVADIMLYNPDSVLVGDDQKQHLELTRDLIEKMNKKYKLAFKIPEAQINNKGDGSRIMALQDPQKKMSKSDDNINNTIFILDNPKAIRAKISAAITDSENQIIYDKVKKPGLANLLTIFSEFSQLSIRELESKFKNSSYRDFKQQLADLLVEKLSIIQENFAKLTDQDIQTTLDLNRAKIQKIAEENLKKIMIGMGIR